MITDSEIIAIYAATGHLAFPFGEPTPHPIDPLPTSLDDPAVMLATESYQSMYAPALQPLIVKHYPNRSVAMVRVDGVIGPAMRELFDQPRCQCPDYTGTSFAERAQGSGGWKGCHGIGDFHAVSIQVTNSPPAHLAPHWEAVKATVTRALQAIGFQCYWDGRAPVNITLTFVSSSDGWIGLATVGNRQETCSNQPGSRWIRLLSTYGQNYDAAKKIRCWSNLVLHEAGHVQSLQHNGSGIMRSYIDEQIPPSWIGDPYEATMKAMYGGVPVPTEPTPPGPNPPPTGNATWPSNGMLQINGKPVEVVVPGFDNRRGNIVETSV